MYIILISAPLSSTISLKVRNNELCFNLLATVYMRLNRPGLNLHFFQVLVLACGVLVGFRYAILVPVLSYLFFKNIRNIYFVGGLSIALITLSLFSWNYLSTFVNFSLNGPNDFSFNNIKNTLDLEHLPILGSALSFCLYFFVNLIMLTGFRRPCTEFL